MERWSSEIPACWRFGEQEQRNGPSPQGGLGSSSGGAQGGQGLGRRNYREPRVGHRETRPREGYSQEGLRGLRVVRRRGGLFDVGWRRPVAPRGPRWGED